MPNQSPMLNFAQFRWLSFDCYGTLIDWESGLLAALRPLLQSQGVEAGDREILEAYSELEPAQQRRSYRPYREILKGVVLGFGERYSFRPSLAQLQTLPDSVASWQPFPDTVTALRRLARKFKLAIISNIDDDLFAATRARLLVSFAQVITSQQAQSYKPAHQNFLLAQERMGAAAGEVLHAAESLYHDIAPCNQLGIRSVWVRRRGARAWGASKLFGAQPDAEVRDLTTLADLAGA